jgi:hypothetical protein
MNRSKSLRQLPTPNPRAKAPSTDERRERLVAATHYGRGRALTLYALAAFDLFASIMPPLGPPHCVQGPESSADETAGMSRKICLDRYIFQ